MKRFLVILAVFCFVTNFAIVGCAPKKAETSLEAINTSKTMQTAEKKTNYLLSQAQAFLDSGKLRDAINTSQYVIRDLDKNSSEAQRILRKSQDAMAVQLQKAAREAREAAKK